MNNRNVKKDALSNQLLKLTLGIPIFMDAIQIPCANITKYLGMKLDAQLRYNERNKLKLWKYN